MTGTFAEWTWKGGYFRVNWFMIKKIVQVDNTETFIGKGKVSPGSVPFSFFLSFSSFFLFTFSNANKFVLVQTSLYWFERARYRLFSAISCTAKERFMNKASCECDKYRTAIVLMTASQCQRPLIYRSKQLIYKPQVFKISKWYD